MTERHATVAVLRHARAGVDAGLARRRPRRALPGNRRDRGGAGPGGSSRVDQRPRSASSARAACPTALSPNLCVKGYFTEVGWMFRHAGEPEACFYRDIAEATGARTLRSVYADVDAETLHGVVILTEDVVAAGRGRSSTR